MLHDEIGSSLGRTFHPKAMDKLCERFRLKPLDFDGRSDSIYHPFDLEGKRHMEYLSYRGEFADVPLGQIEETFRREYLNDSSWNQADFDREVEQETGGV